MGEKKLILITGGARSGKSAFAEQLAEQLGKPITYIATAQILDNEMQERVRIHKERRAEYWLTREAPFDTAAQLTEAGNSTPVILIDCLTLFVTNHLLNEFAVDDMTKNDQRPRKAKVLAAVEKLVQAAEAVPAHVIVVTNEVGLGIVPDNALSRMFRDVAGLANQRLAAAADEVYLIVSGLPIQIKYLQH